MTHSALTAQFAARLAPELRSRGYRKSGPSWHRERERMIQVLNVQKSQWGDQLHLNVGVYLTDLGEETHPTEYRCHIRCRAERLLEPQDFAELRRLLDFDEPIALDKRYAGLRRLLTESALQWFDSNSTVEDLAAELREDRAKRFSIMKDVTEYLELHT